MTAFMPLSRPAEIFFKSLDGEKVAANGETVGIRRDAKWSVLEPEPALVINSRGAIVSCTIGNDMQFARHRGRKSPLSPASQSLSERSCALGPLGFTLGLPKPKLAIGKSAWQSAETASRFLAGETSVDFKIKRTFTGIG